MKIISEKILECDWLRPEVFQPKLKVKYLYNNTRLVVFHSNLKHLHVNSQFLFQDLFFFCRQQSRTEYKIAKMSSDWEQELFGSKSRKFYLLGSISSLVHHKTQQLEVFRHSTEKTFNQENYCVDFVVSCRIKTYVVTQNLVLIKF